MSRVRNTTTSSTLIAGLGVVVMIVGPALSQEIAPQYADDYTFLDLGAVPGVPSPYGGLTFLPDDPETLLIGGDANEASGAIYSIRVERGCVGQIVGFVGEAVLYATAPFIDGGLAHGPDDVLFYTTYPTNTVGQIEPGSEGPDRVVDLTALGVSVSTGSLQFVPEGFAGAGRLKITSYDLSKWYDAAVTPDGNGTFDIVDVTFIDTIGVGPEGVVYIRDANPQFNVDSVLVSEYGGNRISSFEIDANGDAVASTRRNFMTGLGGAEGAAIDDATGDFLFSTFRSKDRVIVVRGFVIGCSADIAPSGGDDVVGFADLLAVLAAWGRECADEDVNADGLVDFTDLLQVLNQWGPCPE